MPPNAVRDELAAVILVGGRSLRMGQPKATLLLDGRPLLAHVVDAVRTLVREIVVVAAAAQDLPLERLAGADPTVDPAVVVVHDRVVAAGPLPALALGLATTRTTAAIALACDAPFVRPPLIADLVARLLTPTAASLDAVVPTWDGHVQPLVAAYRPRLGASLEALVARGEARLQAVARLSGVQVLAEDEVRPFDPEGASFRVLHTPADHAAAERFLAARRGAC
jgi:molybdenum cofactor guanylyltransferase